MHMQVGMIIIGVFHLNSIESVAVVYQIDENLHGYLPTKCEPGNVVIDLEIAVPMIPMKAFECKLCIYCIPATDSIPFK